MSPIGRPVRVGMGVAGVYAALCGAYIVLSDRLVLALAGGDTGLFARLSTLKGLGFIAATTLGLLLVVTRLLAKAEAATDREARANSEARERIRPLMEGTPHLFFFEETLDGSMTMVSPSVAAITGRPVESWLGRHDWFVTPGLRSEPGLTLRRQHRSGEFGGEPVLLEIAHADGSPILLEIHEHGIYREGRLVGIQGIVHDVTRTRWMEERALFQASLLDHVRNGVAATDPEGRILYWNRFAETLLGWPADRVVGRGLAEVLVPVGGRGLARRVIARLRRTGAWEGELEAKRADGSIVPLHVLGALIRDSAGRGLGFVAVATDITERRREERVRSALYRISEAASAGASLERLYADVHSAVAELLPADNFYIALLDRDSGLLTFPYFVDEHDPPPVPKRPGRGLTEVVLRHGEPLLASPEKFEALVKEGEAESIGTPSIDWLGVPLRTVAGKTFGVLVVQSYTEGVRYREEDLELLTFVSRQVAMAIERRRAEEALRASEQRLRDIIEHSTNLFYSHTPEHVLTYISPQTRQFLDCEPEEALVRWTEFATDNPVNEAGFQSTQRAIATGERQPVYPLELVGKQGRTIWVEVNEAPVVRGGRTVAIVGGLTDITERQKLEQQLRQAQKMEAVGRLAGGVAHDFNNLLQAILSIFSALPPLAGDGGRHATAVSELEGLVRRGSALTRQLLLFARQDIASASRRDLNDVTREAAELLRRLVRENVLLVVELHPEPLPVKADQGQVEQVLLNLVVNAVDAMPAGGRIVVRTAKVGREARIDVVDSGEGIPAELHEKVFEPFFSTKGGAGSGLGLSVVHGIVVSHGGRILLQSKPGEGCRFSVYLPLSQSSPELERANLKAENGMPRGNGERVLLVEDEPAVRDGMVQSLEALGYRVVAVESAEAVESLPAGAEFDLLLTDLMLPGAHGADLAARLRRERPGLAVIIMSGYAPDEGLREEIGGGGVHYLQKPFDLGTLARTVRAGLDSRPFP